MQWLMLQQENPEDLVIATGRCETVRKFIEICAKYLGWDKGGNNVDTWEGEGVNEIGKRFDTGEVVIRLTLDISDHEAEHLLGDPKKVFENSMETIFHS